MSNVISASDGLLGAEVVKAAYDRFLRFQLRSAPVIRQFVDVRPVQPSMPGSSIVLKRYNDLAAATTALTEASDVDAVAIPATTNVTVTLAEYGNVVTTTEFLRLTSLADVDPAAAMLVAQNVVDSLESLVMTTARGGSNVTYAGASGAVDAAGDNVDDIASTDVIGTPQIRRCVEKLRVRNAVPWRDENYVALIHPSVSADLRAESGAGGWQLPHQYSAATQIWRGEVGTYLGATFIETNRVYSATDGATSARVYRNLFLGKEALVEASAREPGIVVGPVVDRLERFRHIDWKGTLGWARYREQSIEQLATSSTSALS